MLRRFTQRSSVVLSRRSVKRSDDCVRRVTTSSSYPRKRDDGNTSLSSSPALGQTAERYSSSEAILHASPVHHAFLDDIVRGGDRNEMTSPFLGRHKAQSDDDGFWELFKAISTLNNRHSGLNQLDSTNLTDNEIDGGEESIESAVSSSDANLIHLNERVCLSMKLEAALKESCIHGVLEVFDMERTSSENNLSEKQIGRIITFLADCDAVMSFEATKYLVQKCKAEHRMAPLYLYHYMMSGLKTCTSDRAVEGLVIEIQDHIIEEYSNGKMAVYKYILLPQLAQIVSRLKYNQCARPLVEYFLDEKYPLLNPDIYESLLKTAWRSPFAHEDWTPVLPYHRLLSELVSCGHRPKPDVISRVLHTYYPYRDINATLEILSSIQQLHHYDDHPYDYTIDCGTLETISILSAKRGSVELSLLIIELAESFEYNISESMFEDVILSFAASRQVPQCLGALVDMERKGHIPSRELLRKVAKKLSYDDKRLRYTQHILTGNDNENILSTATMNALMMGYGMKKNIQAAFDVFESFEELGIVPDSHTVTFLLEIIYFSTKQRFGQRLYAKESLSPENVDEVVGDIDIVLSTMKKEQIEATRHFYHEYVRLLCSIDLFDDAKLAIEEAVSNKLSLQVGTIFLLSIQCAHRGDFGMAKEVAKLSIAAGCGKQPTLIRRINNLQNQSLGVWGRPKEEVVEERQ